MTTEEEAALRDEQELAEAEKEFNNPKEGIIDVGTEGEIVEVKGELRAVSNPKDLPHTAEKNQQILIALGFTPHYHDKDKEGNDETNFGIRVMNTKIGVKFNDKNPAGLVWAYELTEGNKKDFYKNGSLSLIPLIQKYLTIQEGKEPIPETTVTGKIVERRGGAIIIEITENGEKKECSFGLGAVKKDDNGAFIPAGFSKATEKNPEQKMGIPRDIRLPDFEKQLAQAPAAHTTKEKDATPYQPAGVNVQKPEDREREKREVQPTGKNTLAKAIIHKDPVTLAEGEKPTVDYYINLIGEITVKVKAEERIPKGEWGYAISKAFDAITKDRRAALIAELKGGEQIMPTAYHNQQDRIDTEKAILFVEHIEEHLAPGQKVICKICGKTIDKIYEEGDHEEWG